MNFFRIEYVSFDIAVADFHELFVIQNYHFVYFMQSVMDLDCLTGHSFILDAHQ